MVDDEAALGHLRHDLDGRDRADEATRAGRRRGSERPRPCRPAMTSLALQPSRIGLVLHGAADADEAAAARPPRATDRVCSPTSDAVRSTNPTTPTDAGDRPRRSPTAPRSPRRRDAASTTTVRSMRVGLGIRRGHRRSKLRVDGGHVHRIDPRLRAHRQVPQVVVRVDAKSRHTEARPHRAVGEPMLGDRRIEQLGTAARR